MFRHRRSFTRVIAAAGATVALLGVAAPSAAQTPAPSAAQTPAVPPFTGGWRDGFMVQSADGNFRLQFGLVAQADGRFVLDDEAGAVIDTFTIRKARPYLQGRIARYFDFQVMPDFGNGTVVLQDAFIDVRFSQAFRVRTGKAKSPVGYEILVGDPFVLLPERSLASSLVPNRDVGVHVLGDIAGGRVFYQGAILNGQNDAASSVADLDVNDSKDLAGRVVVQPFRRAQNPGVLNGLGFALAGSTGTQSGSLPAFRTSVGQRYFGYDAGATATGTRNRVTPAVFFYFKSLGVFAEYVRSTQEASRLGVEREFTNRAWDVTGSFVLTGEEGADRGVRPSRTFDPEAGQWGALQLVARYSRLTVDQDVFADGFAAAGSSREGRQVTVGANWYPVQFLKYYLTYEHISFEGPLTARPDEDSIVFRAQVAF